MKIFKVLLVLFTLGICIYTISVIKNYGFDLVTPFFGQMTAWTWTGQFLFDFQTYLVLSGLWVAWRNKFSAQGILLALIATVFGIMFLAPYLLILSFKENGNMKRILLGKQD